MNSLDNRKEMTHSNAGYIYILQNDSHDNLVLKIGLTRGKPELRAKQLYWGSTGVPEHFDIAVAYSVGDCVTAEAEIHRRLETYRINPKREFFRIDPGVAQIIALNTCENINKKLGLSVPNIVKFNNEKSTSYIKSIPDIPELENSKFETRVVPLLDFKLASVGTSVLSDEQIDQIQIAYLILAEICGFDSKEFVDNFSCDKYPEPEIVIWENIAKVYQIFDSGAFRSVEEKQEAYQFILGTSMLSGEQLENMISNTNLSFESMSSIAESMKKAL